MDIGSCPERVELLGCEVVLLAVEIELHRVEYAVVAEPMALRRAAVDNPAASIDSELAAEESAADVNLDEQVRQWRRPVRTVVEVDLPGRIGHTWFQRVA